MASSEHHHTGKRACLFLYTPGSMAASRSNQDPDSPRWPQEVRNYRKASLLPTASSAFGITDPKLCKKSRRKGSAKVIPLLPPTELIKTSLCCHRCMDQLRKGSSVLQEPKQAGLDVCKAREHRGQAALAKAWMQLRQCCFKWPYHTDETEREKLNLPAPSWLWLERGRRKDHTTLALGHC